MFSITAFYWGNQKNLEAYVHHAKQYTDDITIGFINLFGSVPKIDGLNIVEFDHEYLLKYGHSQLMNIVDDNCKYDWTFHLAVGKRISKFKKEMLDNPAQNIAGFGSMEKENDRDVWSNFHNRKKSKWIKTVHEAIMPLSGYSISNQPIIQWERVGQDIGYDWAKQYNFSNEDEMRICQMYRQFSRIKWVALEDIDPHPARDHAIDMYKKHFKAYSLGRRELLDYLLNNDLNAGM